MALHPALPRPSWFCLQVIEPPDVWDYDLLLSQLKVELQNEGGAPDASKDGEPRGVACYAQTPQGVAINQHMTHAGL